MPRESIVCGGAHFLTAKSADTPATNERNDKKHTAPDGAQYVFYRLACHSWNRHATVHYYIRGWG